MSVGMNDIPEGFSDVEPELEVRISAILQAHAGMSRTDAVCLACSQEIEEGLLDTDRLMDNEVLTNPED